MVPTGLTDITTLHLLQSSALVRRQAINRVPYDVREVHDDRPPFFPNESKVRDFQGAQSRAAHQTRLQAGGEIGP